MFVQARQRHVIEEARGACDARKVSDMVKLGSGLAYGFFGDLNGIHVHTYVCEDQMDKM